MIYKRRRTSSGAPGGFLRFMDSSSRVVSGPCDGDYIRLRDEHGNEWRGIVERGADDTIRYRFRDADGKHISGVGDGYGVVLRDERGKTWRGFLD